MRRVREIFEAALAQDSQSQKQYVAEICGDDADLYTDVITLLDAHEHGHEQSQEPVATQFAAPASSDDHGAFPPGAVVADRFVIVSLLGRGGMGEVYEATDIKLQRQVALKFLAQSGAGDPASRQRLQREARALASLRHPHICTLHDVCSHGDRDFLVMELVEGETLDARVRRQGTLAVGELVMIISQTCESLHFAHQQGILHRDLKPANIMLTPQAGVKLLDFGIAKLASIQNQEIGHGNARDDVEVLATATLTHRAGVVGTLQYMSPEQALGQPLDARSDVFSLGIVMYEIATNYRPFHGDTANEVLNAVINEQPPAVRQLNKNLPVLLERVIAKCLEKSRELRYASAAELATALSELAERRAEGVQGALDFRPGSKTKLWTAAAIVSVLIAGPVYLLIDLRSAVRLACDRPDAVTLARSIAARLGYSLTGLQEKVSFSLGVEFDRVIREHGMDTAREMVRSGRGLAWEIEFAPSPSTQAATQRSPRIAVRIDTVGRLLEFYGNGGSNDARLDAIRLTKPAQEVIGEFLSFSAVRPPDSVWSRGGNWRVRVGAHGWQEDVYLDVRGGRVESLNRRVVTGDMISASDNRASVTRPAAWAVWIYSLQVVIVLYAYGIWIFAKRRRFTSVPWRIPVFLALSGGFGFAWRVFSYAPVGGASVGTGQMLDWSVTMSLLLLPASFGLYLFVSHEDPARVFTLDQLLSGALRNRGTGPAIRDGVLAGGVLAGIDFLGAAVLQAAVRLPDLSDLEKAILENDPWKMGGVSLALLSGLITVSVVATHHGLKRIMRKASFAILTSAFLLALWDVDVSSRRALTDVVFGMAAILCVLLVYQTSGLAAAICANLTWRLTIAGLVGLSLDNPRFMSTSLVLLAIPATLLCAAVLLPMCRRFTPRFN